MNRQIGLKNFIRVVILDPQTKGHVILIQRMRNPKIAMVRYVQPNGRLMILQVSLKLQHGSTWNFRTIFVRLWCNLVHYIRYWTRLQSRDQKLKFLKFKMAAAATLKIDFLAITHRPIVRFQRNFVWGSRTVCKRGLHDKNCKFLKSKMADSRHFENR